jgi:hypothetical protein
MIWSAILISFVIHWGGDSTGTFMVARLGTSGEVMTERRLGTGALTITAPVSNCSKNQSLHFCGFGMERQASKDRDR